MKSPKNSRIMVSLCSLFFVAGAVPAADDKLHPGAFCTTGDAENLSYSHGRVYNQNVEHGITLECPVVNDAPQTHLTSAYVYVLDQHPSQDVYCSLYSVNYVNAGTLASWETRHSTGFSNSPKRLNWGHQGQAGWFDFFTFTCNIPAQYSGFKSGVTAYQVVEY